jgi:hypothetical protein
MVKIPRRAATPEFYDWGNNSPGASALAYAILQQQYGPEIAERYYLKFRTDVIAGLSRSGLELPYPLAGSPQYQIEWGMTIDDIHTWWAAAKLLSSVVDEIDRRELQELGGELLFPRYRAGSNG